ncbi:MAG: HD domain-containing protein [Clostridia bacterium]|nr:HD domain-containing protein [Clostridia bacterium]
MKDLVLIVNDNKSARDDLRELLKDDYEIAEAECGNQTAAFVDENLNNISAVILGIPFEKFKGGTMVEFFAGEMMSTFFPVFVECDREDKRVIVECYKTGITDFIDHPLDKEIILSRLKTIIYLYKDMKESHRLIKEQTEQLKKHNEKLYETNERIIELLGDVVEARNLESGAHVRRVKNFTRVLAEDIKENCPRYGLTDRLVNEIVSASALHDIGKIRIPDTILLKPARLTPEEYEEMKKHTTVGCDLLENAREIWGDEYADICTDIALYHHERYDGNGYPRGLKGDEIPISAQIVSLADVYDALVTQRVYKKPFPPAVAFEMIVEGKCGKFSDRMLECFKRQRENLEALLR